jgi:predicted AAA+ superfamily ATPase
MKRYAFDKLISWKNSLDRKPLIVYGARQVGKTWLIREFGRTQYRQYLEMDFFKNPEFGSYFIQDLDPQRLIKALEIRFNMKICPADTLIFFDEIQECQRAKDSLKYFQDAAPEYHIVAAGSFLGVAQGQFPVGKVSGLTMYPMSFYEFLEAIGRDKLLNAIQNRDFPLLHSMSNLLDEMLKTYFYVGGMPAAVDSFVKYGDLRNVREVQREILQDYRRDFSKHIQKSAITKVEMLWDSIPVHLAKEKKKFIYSAIKVGGRASEFEDALNWLVDTGLVHRVMKTLAAKIPLASYSEREIFKLYMLDLGLLCAKTNIDISAFYQAANTIFSDFQGALAEQYVLQELKQSCQNPIFYWGRDRGDAEVDFLVQYKNEIIPIEVKSTRNTRAKSFDTYIKLEKPNYAIKTSLREYSVTGNRYSIPLYMISSFADIIENKG